MSPRLRQAFRLIHSQPATVGIEIAWRWIFGSVATVLLLLGAKAFLAGLNVSPGDEAAIRGSDPTIIAAALMHLFQQPGVWQRFLAIAFAVALPSTLVWTAAATFGRVAVLNRLSPASNVDRGAVLLLTLARVVLLIACVVLWYVWMVLCAFIAMSGDEPNYPLYLLLSLLAFPVIAIAWGVLNWILSLAPVLAARDGSPARRAYSDTLQLVRLRRGQFMSVTTGLGLPRLAAMVVALIAATVVLIATNSVLIGSLAIAIISLAYCAFADYLYVVRLVAYSQIADKTLSVESNPLLHQER
jgi:hypothetical protein